MIVFKDVQWVSNDTFKILFHGIELVYKIEIQSGIITKAIVRCLNYNSICKIEIDTRKNRIIHFECIGFERDSIKKELQSKLALQLEEKKKTPF